MITCPREIKSQENDHPSNTHGRVHSRTENKVIFAPPAMQTFANKPAERETDHGPASIVHSRCGGQVIQTTDKQRNVNLFPNRVGVPTTEVMNRDGEDGTDDKEIQQGRITDLV